MARETLADGGQSRRGALTGSSCGLLACGLLALLGSGTVDAAGTTQKVTTHPTLDYQSSPSADGRLLAFVSERSGNADVWLRSLAVGAASLASQLTEHPGRDHAPALNADGSKLLYVSHRADPRGDIFVLDVSTGTETRLTDEASADSAPAWGVNDRFYYLREDPVTGERVLVRHGLSDGQAQMLVGGVWSYAVGPEGWLVYSDGYRLLATRESEAGSSRVLTTGDFLDAWPAFADAETIVFTRYVEDTNGDGAVDADDESSIYLGRWDLSTGDRRALFQLTPGREFHHYPAASEQRVYFTDLRRRGIYRIDLPAFLQPYESLPRARELAAVQMDRGDTEQALLTLTNISVNLAPQLPLPEQAEFDLWLVELLRDARRYKRAVEVLERYAPNEGAIGLRARIQTTALQLEARAELLSPAELKRAARERTGRLLALAEDDRLAASVRGAALLEAGRLHLLADDPLTALTYLVRVDQMDDQESRAKALFTRAKIYRRLGEDAKLRRVFLDVVRGFGEDTFWGRRAVAQAVSAAEKAGDVQRAIASLIRLADEHGDLPVLATSALLRAAERYDEQGELRRALAVLDRIIGNFPELSDAVAAAYRKKAEILAAGERYEESASAYAALVELTGRSQEELDRARRLMILQLVRSAVRKREIGEVRIAAKALRSVLEAHPDSVEAHREYIATKVMLGEVAEVQDLYAALSREHPDRAAHRYGLGLALSYSTPPDLPRIIEVIREAIGMEPDVPYFHQTLGWAHEQSARSGDTGALEQAEREYRLALELNDGLQFPEVERNLLLNLGNAYMGLRNYGEAYRHYARRLAMGGGTGGGMQALLYRKRFGEACFKTGRTEEAVEQYAAALRLAPEDQPELRAELLERLGLSHQDAGEHAQAVRYFSEALELNLELGASGNLARLRRNVGVNLYNLSLEGADAAPEPLKRALESYFASLEALDRFGVQPRAAGPGLFQLQVGLGGDQTQAATGFDRRGEEKLMFSYIASTYERLAEPERARDFYLKKLALIPSDGSAAQAAAARTEEAVVLNRLGVLSHAMGRGDEAVAYFERSLERTRELGLGYGTRVNLYNLSRVAAERVLAGGAVDDRVRRTVVEGVEALLTQAEPERLTLYLLANAAFLLATGEAASGLPDEGSVRASVERLYEASRDQQRAVSFYRTALRLLEDDQAFPPDEAASVRLLLTLNLLEFAGAAARPDAYDRLKTEIARILERRPAAPAWLTFLLEAERMTEPSEREALLARAVDALLAWPPPAHPHPTGAGVLPFYDALSSGYVDLLVEKGEPGRAFAVAERIAMRKIAVRLHDALGTAFFLRGLGDYGGDLDALLDEMRSRLREGRAEGLDDLAAEFEELIYAVYEKSPWAVSYLYQYEPAPHVLSGGISPTTPYLAVVPGRDAAHIFVHDGATVHHARAGEADAGTGGLDQATTVYVSAAPAWDALLARLLPRDAAVVKVATVYDVVNAHRLRSLFASRVVVAGDAPLAARLGDGLPRASVVVLSGEGVRDETLLEDRHVLVGAGPVRDYGIVVRTELGVREALPLTGRFGRDRHTAILLEPPEDPEAVRLTLVPALIRSGFAHVVAPSGPMSEDDRRRFVAAYLESLEDGRTVEAVAKAARAVGKEGAGPRVQLYGYAGMDQEEKAAFAAEIYGQAVADTVAAFRAERFDAALRRAEDALAIIGYTEAVQDFRRLTEVAVEAAFRIGEYETAVAHQTKLLEEIDRTGDVDAKPGALYRLGVLHSRLEGFEPAIRHLRAAIDAWRAQEQLDRLAEGVATLGVVQENRGAYSEALEAFGRSFTLYRELGEVANMAAQHRRIGRIEHLRLGRYDRARDSFSAALKRYEELDDRAAQADTLYEIGLTYEKIGLFDDAERRYRAGRRIAETLDDPRLLATGSLYLANTAWFQGRYQEAFEHLTAATRDSERADDPQLPIMIANTKALVYWTLNELDKALVHVQRAVAVAEEQGIETELASSRNNLGLLQRERGDLPASLEQFRRAKQIDERLRSRWGLGYDHRNIGISLMRMGRYEEARASFEEAARISAAIDNVNNWVKALLELGNLGRETEDHETALEHYRRTYEISKRHGMKEVLWRAAAGKGAVLRALGRKEDAVRWYAEAVDVVEGMRAALKIEEFRNSFQSKTQDLYRDIITLLVELGRDRDAFDYLERSRARSFIDLLGNQKLELKTPADQQAFDRVTELRARADALAAELASFETPPDDLARRSREATVRYEEALLLLKQRHPQLGGFVAVDPLTQAEVQALLEPGVGLLSYKVTADRLFLWLLTSSGTRFYQVAAAEGEIDRLVRTYREGVQRLEPVSEELRRLYELLVAPARPDLEGLGYLGVIPDGPLHFLSFAALQGPSGYLVDEFRLFYAPAASVLRYTFAKRSATKRTKVLAVGNPDLGDYNYELPLAELEARSIRWDFPDVEVRTGERATKEWIIEHVGQFGIVHLATHGEFDDLNPLLSSLWFASPQPQNRRLTVQEVFSLDLRADLVTLSACQTGLGKLEAGELIGLNRAFIYAGTHALVSALWRVDDLATSVLMKHFYRNYVRMDKATSLRQAQLQIKREFPHPAYWAGLVLVGDYR